MQCKYGNKAKKYEHCKIIQLKIKMRPPVKWHLPKTLEQFRPNAVADTTDKCKKMKPSYLCESQSNIQTTETAFYIS